MSLRAGEQLGPYRIEAQIGAGGMGEVYRARDPRLGRPVAIKVVAAEFSAGAERLGRFEQEARAAGQLNHPNILAVYDVGSHHGVPYIVSELLEGETLHERLAEGPLPTRKAIAYALQMAAGLTAAHNKQIVHRDLKPENLFLTTDGHLKILDFGLAKLKSHTDERTSKETRPPTTEAGTVLGTVGYMSPEQVRGVPADYRSDIFSFGAIVYEMLSGARAFRRESSVETMNAILTDEPPEVPQLVNTSPALDRIVRRCLEKRADDRFHSAHDLALALDAVMLSPSSGGAAGSGATDSVAELTHRGRGRGFVLGAAVSIAALLAGVEVGRRSSAMTDSGMAPASFQRLTYRRGSVASARFSPDGQTIVFSAAWDGQPTEMFMTRTEGPDSRALGLPWEIQSISSHGEMAILNQARLGHPMLARAPLAGGAPREVLEPVGAADWCPDGQLAALRWGTEQAFIEFPIGNVVYQTQFWRNILRVSPKGDAVAFIELDTGSSPKGSIVVVDRQKHRTVVATTILGNESLAWSPGGDELWFTSREGSGTALYAASLTGVRRLVARMDGFMLLNDIARDGRLLLARVNPRASVTGLAPGETRERDLSWFSESYVAALSADGRLMAITERAPGAGGVYLRRTDGSAAIRLGEGSAGNFSPDDKWVIAVRDTPSGLILLPTGAGLPRTINMAPVTDLKSAYWFADGRRILLNGAEPGHRIRYYVLDTDTTQPAKAITPEGTNDYPIHQTPVSPDGKWLFAWDVGQSATVLFPIDGGPTRTIPDVPPGNAVAWAGNGAMYVAEGSLPLKVFRLDLATGRRTLWRELMPPDPAGVDGIYEVHVSQDGKAYAYTYGRVLSELYIASGFK